MTGPYKAHIFLEPDPTRYFRNGADLVLTWETERDALEAGARIGCRYYQDGGSATLLGTRRAATFYIGSILASGESARIEVRGRLASEKREDADTGYSADIRRDVRGRIHSSLGLRYGGERVIRGL
jgi:hypothetical protein